MEMIEIVVRGERFAIRKDDEGCFLIPDHLRGAGTALKPAMEPIVLARKPLEGTVAQNVMNHGVGGINIDGCRVEAEGETISNHGRNGTSADSNAWGVRFSPNQNKEQTEGQKLGRFPANFIHDGSDEVVSLFPDSKGQIAPVKGTEPSRTGQNGIYGTYGRTSFEKREEDDLSAARFFYCAKASRKDRDEGLDEFTAVRTGAMKVTENASLLTSAGNARDTKRKNTHNTVKPTDLMSYLCRLVTPPGGTILDPFMGSGSTGKAAMYEGFNFIGIELLEEHMVIAEARIQAAKKDAYEISIGMKKTKAKKTELPQESDVDITKFFG